MSSADIPVIDQETKKDVPEVLEVPGGPEVPVPTTQERIAKTKSKIKNLEGKGSPFDLLSSLSSLFDEELSKEKAAESLKEESSSESSEDSSSVLDFLPQLLSTVSKNPKLLTLIFEYYTSTQKNAESCATKALLAERTQELAAAQRRIKLLESQLKFLIHSMISDV